MTNPLAFSSARQKKRLIRDHSCRKLPRLSPALLTAALSLLFFGHRSPAYADNLLTGTIIGTSGSYNNIGNTKEKAMDGNTATFFDGPTPSGDWVGLDMTGQLPKMVTSVRYFPRASFAGRMVNGIFQGANVADFSVAVNLYTITSSPPAGVYSSQTITATNAFSYVRYLAPTNGSGNVSELEFYGVDLANPGAPSMPTNLSAAAGDRQVNLTWTAATNATSYKVKRGATNAVGPFSVIASGIITTNYTDTNVVNGTAYYYRVLGTNANGDGPDSASALATPQVIPTFGLYRQLWTGLSSAPGNTLDALTNTTYNPSWPNNPNLAYTRVYTNFETETSTGVRRLSNM